MLVSVAVICLLMVGGDAGRQLVPGRFQSMAEVSYEFVATMIRSNAGAGRDEVLPASVLTVHVHLGLKRDRHHSLHLHGLEPHHRYCHIGAARVLHGADLRLLQERLEIL